MESKSCKKEVHFSFRKGRTWILISEAKATHNHAYIGEERQSNIHSKSTTLTNVNNTKLSY